MMSICVLKNTHIGTKLKKPADILQLSWFQNLYQNKMSRDISYKILCP